MRGVVAAAVLASLCFATASADEMYVNQISWLAKPISAEWNSNIQTAQVGEFLFRQDFVAASEAVLNEQFELAVASVVRRGQTPPRVSFERDAVFVMIQGVTGRQVYCDPRITLRTRNVFGEARQRACLVDDESDGVFDRVMWSLASTEVFARMTMYGVADEVSNASFSVRSGNLRLFGGGPVVTRSALGTYRMEFAVVRDGEPVVLGDLDYHGRSRRPNASGRDLSATGLNFRASDVPLVVEMLGARVEILSAERESLTYRVHSMFDSNRTVGFGYTGVIPVE